MKKMIWTAALITCLSFTACAPKPVTITTQAGAIAYTSDQIVLRVNELQNVAIQMNTSGMIDTGTTRVIVTWTKDADTILKTLPNGWRASLAASWIVAKANIHITNPPVLSAMAAIDAVLGGL